MRYPWSKRTDETAATSPRDGGPVPTDDSLFLWEYNSGEEPEADRFSLIESAGSKAVQGNRALVDATSDQSISKEVIGSNWTAPEAVEQVVSGVPPKLIVSETSPGLIPLPGEDNAQIRYLRHNLDAALLVWQTRGSLPEQALLQRALDSLDAGTRLGQDQLTLLLRASLAHRQSVLTALKHQEDPERTGVVIAEAMTMAMEPFPAEFVRGLRERDANGELWFGYLLEELRSASASNDVRIRRRAVDAQWELQGYASAVHGDRLRWRSLDATNVIVATVLILVVFSSAIIALMLNRGADDLAVISSGTYSIAGADGSQRTVMSEGFAILAHEVTNREFRQCVAKAECEPPVSEAVAGIPDYYSNPMFEDFPVVNVTALQAEEYCRAGGMRLPTDEEWMLAAVAAPKSGITLVYPWGVEHDVQRANTLELRLQSPAAVGSFSPAGDSPIGAADLSGNVAEWTSTSVETQNKRIVKGGSYRDTAKLAAAAAEQIQSPQTATDWIGFRCVRPAGTR